ncbi:hypothetical protein HCJ66_10340 [Listeria sp. FSL L7-1582]|uniref:hypothetical protein n=1 Tax=Listeria portnoyi TaxID=2713504 RepID=UPI00164E6C4C|nr:hypothetical protein [Listeria portnoyi]MBC6309940.1 hypothetical protein [Listeria portnoyi]
MYRKWDLFYNNHPYWGIVIAVTVGSVLGILIEYAVNGDFLGSGIYGVLFYVIFQVLLVMRRERRQAKVDKNK